MGQTYRPNQKWIHKVVDIQEVEAALGCILANSVDSNFSPFIFHVTLPLGLSVVLFLRPSSNNEQVHPILSNSQSSSCSRLGS